MLPMDEIKILNMIQEHDKYLLVKILSNALIRDLDEQIEILLNELNKSSKEIRITCLENNSKLTYAHCISKFNDINNKDNY